MAVPAALRRRRRTRQPGARACLMCRMPAVCLLWCSMACTLPLPPTVFVQRLRHHQVHCQRGAPRHQHPPVWVLRPGLHRAVCPGAPPRWRRASAAAAVPHRAPDWLRPRACDTPAAAGTMRPLWAVQRCLAPLAVKPCVLIPDFLLSPPRCAGLSWDHTGPIRAQLTLACKRDTRTQ